MQERHEWVDQLRFIGIIAVILGHIASPFSSFIYSWHMPLFFMISGFFLDQRRQKPISEIISNDFKRLMIPYFIFSFFGLLVEWVKRVILNRDELDFWHEIGSILFRMDYPSLQNHYGFVLWFLPALFFSRMLYSIIFGLPVIGRAGGVFAVLSLFLISFKFKLPFEFDVAMNALFWVFAGSVLFKFHKLFFGNSVLLFTLVFTCSFAFFFSFPQLNMSEKQYSSLILNVSWVVLFVSAMVLSLRALKRHHVPEWSKETMFLMIFHPYTNNISHLIVEKLMPGAWLIKLIATLGMLQLLIIFKRKIGKVGVFKYV